MNGFYGFVITFCTVCVLTAGLNMLCPSGALEKAVRYVLGLVFLVCILGALPAIQKFSPDISVSSAQDEETELNMQMTELAFKLALKNSDIQFSKITVCTDKSADGGIIINKVIVHSSDSPEAIRQALGGDDAEYAVEVIYG